MALAEARALVADLLALPWDGESIARAALEVTTALLAASPRVAWAGGGLGVLASAPLDAESGGAGLWLVDAAGLGSEATLARRLARLAGDLGYGPVRVGVADSAVAAYAATYGRANARTRGQADTRTEGVAPAGPATRRPPHERNAAAGVPSDGRSPAPPRDAAPGAASVRPSTRPRVRPTVVPPGGDAAFLAPFPLALLEPGEDLADTCHALGLGTVGRFAALDADEVESRFGPEGLALHRLARGLDTRGPSVPRDDALPLVTCDLGSPVATAEPLLFVLKGALGSLGTALRAKGLAAREIALTLTLDDGSLAEKAVRPARPTSHEGALFDHCRAAFDAWALPEPVTALAVRAAVTVAASGEQGDLLAPRWADPAALEAAFERIRGREGADAVATPAERDGHLPGDAGVWRTDGRADAPTHRRAGAPSDRRTARPPPGLRERRAAAGESSERRGLTFPSDAAPPATRALRLATTPERPAAAALRLLAAPLPIRVRLGRAGLEALRHGDTWHDVTAWSGPERLVPRWWVPRGAEGGAGPRDYYSARTADGALWLLFRSAASRRWFVEGWWD